VLNHEWLGLEQQTGNGCDIIIEEESCCEVSQAGRPIRKTSDVGRKEFNLRLPEKRETGDLVDSKQFSPFANF
jgi:hypothetical protein